MDTNNHEKKTSGEELGEGPENQNKKWNVWS